MEFGLPPKGDKATVRAYGKHVGRARMARLDDELLDRAAKRVAKQCGLYHIDVLSQEESESYTAVRARVANVLATVALDKTCGYPLTLTNQFNGDLLEERYDEVVRICCARFRLLSLESELIDEVLEDPWLVTYYGLKDPTAVFIKNEPHPRRKLEDGRFRCITPVSLIDQVCEKIDFEEESKLLIAEGPSTGSAIGLGFTDDMNAEHARFITDVSERFGGFTASSDVSGFDALHTRQTHLAKDRAAHLSVRSIRPGVSLARHYRHRKRRTVLMVQSVSVIGGRLYYKVIEGCMDSGSSKTSADNTKLRLLYSACAFDEVECFPCAAGDDCTECSAIDKAEDLVKMYAALGITLRDVRIAEISKDNPTPFEFCSHRYEHGPKAVLLSWRKSVYKFAAKAEHLRLLDDARQILQEMRFCDDGVRNRTWRFLTSICCDA